MSTTATHRQRQTEPASPMRMSGGRRALRTRGNGSNRGIPCRASRGQPCRAPAPGLSRARDRRRNRLAPQELVPNETLSVYSGGRNSVNFRPDPPAWAARPENRAKSHNLSRASGSRNSARTGPWAAPPPSPPRRHATAPPRPRATWSACYCRKRGTPARSTRGPAAPPRPGNRDIDTRTGALFPAHAQIGTADKRG